MKIQAHDNQLETNVQSESKEFGIGDASVVIEILRNRLYENKVRTLVQEYICNARDAHREVGKDASTLEITMPTRLSPTFKVKDFGPGISTDRMDRVFRLYGASTKRGSNNQTGGFGIGAKSAWSYTDSFTVVTVVDGSRRTYVCHTGHNNQGSLDLIKTDHTDEPNGTEIQIAVRNQDIDEFRFSVLRVIYFWESRPTVKGYDGELPSLVGGYKVSDNIETIDRQAIPEFIDLNYNAKALAVIDGVPYFITEKLLNKTSKLNKFLNENVRKAVILHFGNGIVEVSASRESIADSQFTIDALNKMGTKADLVLKTHIGQAFAKVNSIKEWIDTYNELNPYFAVDQHSKFGEYKIQDREIVSDNLLDLTMISAHCLDKRGRYRVERITKEQLNNYDKSIPIGMLDNVFVVTKKETKIVENKRLRTFFAGKPNEFSKVILIEYTGDTANVDKVIADLGIKPFESIQYEEKPREPKVKIEREHAEFCMHSFGGRRHQYTTLAENTNKYLYVKVIDGNWEGFNQNSLRELHYYLSEEHGLAIVGLAERAVKMVKGDKNFRPLSEWLADYKPTVAEVNFAISTKARNSSDIQCLVDVDGIKDDFLTGMIKEYKSILAGSRKIRSIPEMLIQKVQEESNTKAFFDKDEKLAKLLEEKYPLIIEIGGYTRHKKELAVYINAKYTN